MFHSPALLLDGEFINPFPDIIDPFQMIAHRHQFKPRLRAFQLINENLLLRPYIIVVIIIYFFNKGFVWSFIGLSFGLSPISVTP